MSKRGRGNIAIPARELEDMARFTKQEIAAFYGVHHGTVCATFRKLGITHIDARSAVDALPVNHEWLRTMRKRLEFTHAQFAAQLGLSPRRLESWMYERSIPLAWRRVVYLAVQELLHRKSVSDCVRRKRHTAIERLAFLQR